MTIIEFVQAHQFTDDSLIGAVAFCLIVLIIHDTYHQLVSAVLSWFKKN